MSGRIIYTLSKWLNVNLLSVNKAENGSFVFNAFFTFKQSVNIRDTRRFPNLFVHVRPCLQIIGFILQHLDMHAHGSQLVSKDQVPGVLFTCANYKEVEIKRQLHFQSLNLNTVSFRLMTER